MRNLYVIESKNQGALREFNRLRIANLEEFFESYPNNIELYKPPFEILYELEKAVKYENQPEETVLVSYKDDGDIIFDLVEIKEEGNHRVVIYEFSTFIS